MSVIDTADPTSLLTLLRAGSGAGAPSARPGALPIGIARRLLTLGDTTVDTRELHRQAACSRAGVQPEAWTPEYEEDHVPQRLLDLCRACPVWDACLVDAVRMNDIGYRASTTTRERRHLFGELAAAGRRGGPRGGPFPGFAHRADDGERVPQHPRGEGSLTSYRRGCRCDECRGHNAAARRRERARAS